MLNLFYPSLRAFARDCHVCSYSARAIIESGEYVINSLGQVIVSDCQ